MFSVQVPDWCLNKRSVVLFLEARFFSLNNKSLYPFYKGPLFQRAGRIYRSPLINSHMAYCLIGLRRRAKWFQPPTWKGEREHPRRRYVFPQSRSSRGSLDGSGYYCSFTSLSLLLSLLLRHSLISVTGL